MLASNPTSQPFYLLSGLNIEHAGPWRSLDSAAAFYLLNRMKKADGHEFKLLDRIPIS